jgi:NTP pyrophosphatase (non-canonical NTP hydrolase)
MKNIQQRIKEFTDTHNLNSPAEVRMLDLVSEAGEVAKEIIKSTDYGTKEFQLRPELKSELGDLLFSLTVLANQLDIDLDEALDIVLQKYEKRLSKGSAGSENE